jgi:hypothetical protein
MVKTAKEFYDEHYSDDTVVIMKDYAKMLTDRMYTEEEVYKLLCSMPNFFNMTILQQIQARKKWFEQFKKK